MKSAILGVIGLAVVGAQPVKAQTSDWTIFIPHIGSNAVATAKWLYLLNTAEDVCGFSVNRTHLAMWLGQMRMPLAHVVERRLGDWQSGRKDPPSDIVLWRSYQQAQPEQACEVLLTLWGDAGRQFPGVLSQEWD